MTARLLVWYRERSLREQRLLLLMFALLAVTLLWLAIYRPMQVMLSSARERQQQAVVRLGDVKAQADALRALGGVGSPSMTAPLAPIVSQTAAEAGFANALISPQGERRVSVSIPSARPAPFLAWIAALETRGIVVERLSANASGGATLAVDVTLTGGG